MVVVDSRRVPRVPRYSGACHEPHHFRLRGYHPLWPAFPGDSTSGSVGNSPALNRAGPSTPDNPKTIRFGLFRVRSPLLAESLTCFLFLQVLRWFTSLRSLPWPMYSARDNPRLIGLGCPIRESTGQSLFAALRRLSQLTTPFIAF